MLRSCSIELLYGVDGIGSCVIIKVPFVLDDVEASGRNGSGKMNAVFNATGSS
jgi:hypothetical protein